MADGTQAIADALNQGSALEYAKLDQAQKQFDATLGASVDKWSREGLPYLVIAQRAQALAEKQAAFNDYMAQANLGLQYLDKQSQLRGPNNYFQASDFARGAAATGQLPSFLRALTGLSGMGSFAGGTNGQPGQPATFDTLGNMLTGQSAGTGGVNSGQAAPGSVGAGGMGGSPYAVPTTGGTGAGVNDNQLLQGFNQVFQNGGASLAPNTLEGMTSDELGLLTSAGDKLGYSLPAFMKSYAQGKIGQGAAGAY